MANVTRYFHADAGHGWLAVKKAELVKLGIADQISGYSYMRGQTAYLEEDRDAGVYLNALKARGDELVIREGKHRDYSPIRSYASYIYNGRNS